MKRIFSVLVSCFCCFQIGLTQSNKEKAAKFNSSSKLDNIRNVEEAYKDNNPDKAANEWVQLGARYADQKNYSQSNVYYQKALEIYKNQKNAEKQAEILRKIGYNNEALNQDKEAVYNYNQSFKMTNSPTMRQANTNDISRVQHKENEQAQNDLLDENLAIFEKQNDKDAVVQTYIQKAEVAIAKKDTNSAIKNLKKASEITEHSEKAIVITEQLASIYAQQDSIPIAIETTIQTIQRAEAIQDWDRYFDLNIQLSTLYLQSKQSINSIALLEQTLEKAYSRNNSQAITKITQAIMQYWNRQRQYDKANSYATRYMDAIINIMQQDSFLLQNKLFDEIAEKVNLLEKEKNTQTELYKRTQTFNIALIIMLAAMLLTISGIIWSLRKLKTKNLQVQLQSLRREMNPHFIFNSLNSVNQFIAENNELAANKYLTKYATLMRNVLSTSNKDFVSLKEEIEALQHYVSLEALRFEGKFEYTITIDPELDNMTTAIPNMLMQPVIENAIWHGLRYKKDKGFLKINIYRSENQIIVEISDDGIGVAASKQMKTKHQQTYVSRGIKNTLERIEVLNQLYHTNISYTTEPLNKEDASGTVVIIQWKNQLNYVASQN